MKLITGFSINTDNLDARENNRDYIVSGQDGAVFSLKVQRASDLRWYDFVSNTFTVAETSRNRLANKTIQGTFSSSLFFPAAASGDTYTIYLFAEPHFDTEIETGLSVNPVLYTTILKQVSDSIITIGVKSSNEAKYGTLPSSVTSTGSPVQTGTTVVDINWNFIGATTSGNSFGIKLTDQPGEEDWIWRTQDTVNGTVSSSTTVIVDSVDGIYEGMTIIAVSAGSLSGTPTIVSLNKERKLIKLSTAQTFADGITLTFKSSTPKIIKDSTGLNMKPIDITAAAVQLTKTVRGAISNSTTINLNGTYGVSKGATVRGVSFSNSEANPVVSVSASSSAGSMAVTTNQTLTAGTKLYIDGCGNDMTIKGKIEIHKYPTSNQTIYLDLDGIFTPGTAS